jgi:hypothetical protein
MQIYCSFGLIARKNVSETISQKYACIFFNIITVLINFVPFKTNQCFFPLTYVFMVNADIYRVVL